MARQLSQRNRGKMLDDEIKKLESEKKRKAVEELERKLAEAKADL